jgi:hypothetical protein
MLRLHALGWGVRRIAAELGVSKNTVKRYLRQGGWVGYGRAARAGALAAPVWTPGGLAGGALPPSRGQRRGGAPGVAERASGGGLAAHGRARLCAAASGTGGGGAGDGALRDGAGAAAADRLRYPAGRDRRRTGAGLGPLFRMGVATLGYSRRCYVQAFDHERQSAWFDGMEGAFRHFGGVPEEVLLDNARALVAHHDPQTREVQFNERLRAFAGYWGFRPGAHQRQRRTHGRLRQGQRPGRAAVRLLGGVGDPPRRLAARGGRRAPDCEQDGRHRRAPAGSLRGGSCGVAPVA